MLGLKELDTILAPGSSDEEILAAFPQLELENLSAELINAAIEKLQESADIHPDMLIELHELGRFSIDCSGTGGSGMSRFNTSTAVAFVLAAAGFKVAKFGARAASGKSGSFDFLDCLGISSNLPVQRIADALSVCGIAFIFAPNVYPQLKRLAPLRKIYARPTILNYIGPLLNPVRPAFRLMGVSSDPARKLVAEQIRNDGRTKNAMLVTSAGRLDEFHTDNLNDVSLIDGSELHEFQLDPKSLPLVAMPADQADGAEEDFGPEQNAAIFRAIISAKDNSSSCYRMLLLNSGAALFLLKAGKSIEEGVALAAELIAAGHVQQRVLTCGRFYEQLSR